MGNLSKDEGHRFKPATPAQRDSYRVAQQQVHDFATPVLYQAGDPHARVFFALFDGTAADMAQDPEHLTNVGALADQLLAVAAENADIAFFYKEGVGTQGGLPGLLDKAWGGSFGERLEVMYDKFSLQAAHWIAQDPQASISVIALGFSRGAEQAAAFSRLLDARGVPVQEARQAGMPNDAAGYSGVPPLRAPGAIAQALALYDPVGTGEPQRHDRRPAPSVVTGLQISADDERRHLFPRSDIIEPGLSADGRFLGVVTAGAHSDIGGGFLMDGLARSNFNLMAEYLNGVLGAETIAPRAVPAADELVVHGAWWGYLTVDERAISSKLEPSGKLAVEARDPQFDAVAGTRTPPGLRSEAAVLSVEDTSTAAFGDIGRHQELALVLRDAAERLRDGQTAPFALEDTNGNDVGSFTLRPGGRAPEPALTDGGLRISFDLGKAAFRDQPMQQVAGLLDGVAERIANAGTDAGFGITDERGALLGMVAIDHPALTPLPDPAPEVPA